MLLKGAEARREIDASRIGTQVFIQHKESGEGHQLHVNDTILYKVRQLAAQTYIIGLVLHKRSS